MVRLSADKLLGCRFVNVISYTVVLIAAIVGCIRSPASYDEITWLLAVAVFPAYTVKLLMMAADWYYGYRRHDGGSRTWIATNTADVIASILVLAVFSLDLVVIPAPQALSAVGRKFLHKSMMIIAVNAVILTWMIWAFWHDYQAWRQADDGTSDFSSFVKSAYAAKDGSGGGKQTP